VVDQVLETFDAEGAAREDLRLKKRIFTIDPATAKDLDDAIHVEQIEPDIVEVGVHIADVGHFVKTSTPLDDEAQKRTTSIYMPDRVLPMLPHKLSNNLCSLNPDEGKLTFSAFYRINVKKGEVFTTGMHAPRFAKTVIRSCCRLNYEEAQNILDDPNMEPLPVTDGFTWKEIVDDMHLLYKVCGQTKKFRYSDGGMHMNKAKMVFHTRGTCDGIPRDYHLESHSPSHWIIQELMLMANRCVARFLAESPLEDLACLRNHAKPDGARAKGLADVILECGIKWKAGDSKSLQDSLDRIEKDYGAFVCRTIEVLVMQHGMKQAQYFIVNTLDDEGHEQLPFHYALNYDYYTHFTSPIRRYPDILVHRCLQAILEKKTVAEHLALYQKIDAPPGLEIVEAPVARECDDDDGETGEMENEERQNQLEKLWSQPGHLKLRELCKRSNEKKKAHKEASEMCDRAFFCLYLKAIQECWFTHVSLIMVDVKKEEVIAYAHLISKDRKISLRVENFNSDVENMPDFATGLTFPVKAKAKTKNHLRLYWRKPGMEPDPPAEENISEELEEEEGRSRSPSPTPAIPNEEDEEEEEENDDYLVNDVSIHVQDVYLFGALPVAIVPLNTVPIDYAMVFLSPFHPKFSDLNTTEFDGFRGGFPGI